MIEGIDALINIDTDFVRKKSLLCDRGMKVGKCEKVALNLLFI